MALDRNEVKSKHIAKSQVKPSDINKSAEAAWIFVDDPGKSGDFQRANGSPGVRVVHLATGSYRVRFPFSVRDRALATPTDYQNTQRDVSLLRCGGASFFDANCAPPHPNDARTVLVTTVAPGGTQMDTSFWLAAIP